LVGARRAGAPARGAAAGALDRWHGGFGWLPVPVPRDPNARAPAVRRAVAALEPAIDGLAQRRPTCGRPVVIGFSQGAVVAFGLAVGSRPVVAAVFPVSGRLPPVLWPSPLAGPVAASGSVRPTVFALHGTIDPVMPFAAAQATVARLRAAGFAAEIRRYTGVGHTITPAMDAELARRLGAALRAQRCAPPSP
jgi:phospholipase/carboxylesterase